jgi:endonuclease YncB( thermonuclease family)
MLAPTPRGRHPSSPSRRSFAAALLAVATLLPALGFACPTALVQGVAIRVHDGDSFVARLEDGSTTTVRLAGIDAPERTQPWADVSRRHLRDLLHDRTLQIEPLKRDAYGRTVARVLLLDGGTPGLDVGLLQLDAGLAWHFVRYAREQPPGQRDEYARAESGARQRQQGLWRDPRPVAPWDFRSARRRGGEAAPARPPPPYRER